MAARTASVGVSEGAGDCRRRAERRQRQWRRRRRTHLVLTCAPFEAHDLPGVPPRHVGAGRRPVEEARALWAGRSFFGWEEGKPGGQLPAGGLAVSAGSRTEQQSNDGRSLCGPCSVSFCCCCLSCCALPNTKRLACSRTPNRAPGDRQQQVQGTAEALHTACPLPARAGEAAPALCRRCPARCWRWTPRALRPHLQPTHHPAPVRSACCRAPLQEGDGEKKVLWWCTGPAGVRSWLRARLWCRQRWRQRRRQWRRPR